MLVSSEFVDFTALSLSLAFVLAAVDVFALFRLTIAVLFLLL
jgi:hypothetical protein